FRPEFLNRTDAVVVFRRLERAEMRLIVDILVRRITEQLGTQEIKIDITDAAKDKIAVEGFDKIFGARPLRRVIQRVIEDPLAEQLLRSKFNPGDTVLVEIGEEAEVKLTHVPGPASKKEKAAREAKEPAAAGATPK